jgi:hypothetical protein
VLQTVTCPPSEPQILLTQRVCRSSISRPSRSALSSRMANLCHQACYAADLLTRRTSSYGARSVSRACTRSEVLTPYGATLLIVAYVHALSTCATAFLRPSDWGRYVSTRSSTTHF